MKFGVKEISIICMVLLSAYFYYIYYPVHSESKQFVPFYYGMVLFIYSLYIGSKHLLGVERRSYITVKFILGIFLLQLLLLSCGFFSFAGVNMSLGTFLFLKIVSALIGISLLWTIFWALGKIVLDSIPKFSVQNQIVLHIISLGVGFLLGMYGVFILAALGMYNFLSVLCLLASYAILGHKNIILAYKSLGKPIKEYSHNTSNNATIGERYNVSRIIDELHIIVITFLISINFISVYRPFPIGWDDLGVYMNFPKLVASSGELLGLGKMYMWELYTSLGFVFGNQTYAFLLNSFSGVIVAGILYCSVRVLLPQNKNSLFDFGFLAALIVLMMPMTVFQIAKDMKLDIGLLSMSLVAFVTAYYTIFTHKNEGLGQSHSLYIIVGLLLALCFSIKITSLLLLLGIFALVFYKHAGFYGVLGFFCIFSGVFTFLGLWKLMNIIVPNNSFSDIAGIILLGLGVGIVSVYLHAKKDTQNISHICMSTVLILLGFIIGLLPWGIKNVHELQSHDQQFTVGRLLGGFNDRYTPEYEKIYTPEEINQIESDNFYGLSGSGNTNNADWGRYFGYEGGINNYLKLPWNLTFQTNQGGEFTDISFVFFALIPMIFIFLPLKRPEYSYVILFSVALLLLYYIPGFKIPYGGETLVLHNPVNILLTNIFSHITIPIGYGVLVAFFFLPFFFFSRALNKSSVQMQLFLSLLAFTSIYVLLWSLSSYGVVWYGIVMYSIFVLMIGAVLSHNDETQQNPIVLSSIVLVTIWIYLLQSAIPHGIVNLKGAGYGEYKLGYQTPEVAIMRYHPEYLPILFTLNIDKDSRQEVFTEYRNDLLTATQDIPNSDNLRDVIKNQTKISQLNSTIKELLKADLGPISPKIKQIQQNMYEEVLYPSDENKNTDAVYRVGTFLKYFISDNISRLQGDALLEQYGTYIDHEDTSVISDRFKALGLTTLIVDLNAATIDNDPEKGLTKRYEKLLRYFTDDSLELIETDSVCLRVALDTYKIDKDMEKYLMIAGVNHGNKGKKLQACYGQILVYIQENKITDTDFSYLKRYEAYIRENTKPELSTADYIQLLHKVIPQSYKVLFEIN